MPAPTDSPAAILAQLVQEHTGEPTDAADMQAVASGASGRCIMRAHGVLGIHWTAARADNGSFLPAAKGLVAAGVRVPAVLAERELPQGSGACLVTDLGTTDLLSLRGGDWAALKAAYREAFLTLRPFYTLRPSWPLQPPFDEELYRWEQGYFAEHLIGRHFGGDAAAFMAEPALLALAAWLAALPRVPIHRDCQSQNIMLCEGRAYLIDFQGMRYGREEYDLASLLCDPYMAFTAEQRAELMAERSALGIPAPDAAVFAACAMQRLMQALGAYANIGYNQGRNWYLQQIEPALRLLREVMAAAPADSPAATAAACLRKYITA